MSAAVQTAVTNGRRQRRKEDTRRRLLAAARRLFVEHGYHATRPQDIARAADVGSGTFYLHFADKSEAFLAFTEEASRELVEVVRAHAAHAGGFEEQLRLSLEALLSYTDRNPGVLRAAFADGAVIAALPTGESLRDRLAQILAGDLRRGIADGELVADFDPDLIAHGIVGLVHQALIYGSRSQIDRSALLHEVTRFCGRALVRRGAGDTRDGSPRRGSP